MPEEKQFLYEPTEKERKATEWVYDNFSIMWENSQQAYPQFGNKTPLQYWDGGRKAINVLQKAREDGRSNVKSVAPLNKLKAILARVALQRPSIEVEAYNQENDIDPIRGRVIKDYYINSYERLEEENTADTEYFFKAWDCQTDGTQLSYEGYDGQEHVHKKIISFDQNTGEVKWEEEKFRTDKCFNQSVKPEDFFVWNVNMRSLQNQPRVCWRTVYDKAKFDEEFGGYKKAKYVMTGSQLKEFNVSDSVFQKNKTRISEKEVEVLRMYDRGQDRMVVIANSIVLQDSPIPFKNGKPKKYPFAKTIASPFAGGEFFWGMHLWHVLEGDVSSLETLHNLGIEQEKIAVNPPTLTTSGNDIEDNMLAAGRVLEVDNIANFRELNFKSPDQSYFNFVELIGKNIDFASVDPVSSGINVKDATARGQVIAEENARKLLSLFNIMMENMVLQEAKLRIPNIIQFMVVPGTFIRVKNTQVGRETGTREIRVVEKAAEMESQSHVEMLEHIAEVNGINLERLNITPQWLEGIQWNIRVVSESSYQQSKSIAIALEREKIGTVASLFPEFFQSGSEIFFKELMKKYDDDPQKYLDAMQKKTGMNNLNLVQGRAGGQGRVANDLLGGKGEMGLVKLTGVE